MVAKDSINGKQRHSFRIFLIWNIKLETVFSCVNYSILARGNRQLQKPTCAYGKKKRVYVLSWISVPQAVAKRRERTVNYNRQ
jgi:hypothetical protein